MPRLSCAAVAHLVRAKESILANPHLLNMGTWVHEEPCGTSACIAGWIALNAGWTRENKDEVSAANFALELLGGPDTSLLFTRPEEANWKYLFLMGWPEEIKTRYYNASSFEERARAAAMAIDHFIANDGRM